MASIFKIIARTTVPPQTITKSSMCLPVSTKIRSRLCSNGGGQTLYDCRKYGHNLSTYSVRPCFECLIKIPTGVFRETSGEVLGLGARKGWQYQNPEYFSYHHMSFYDLNMGLRQYRLPRPESGRKPN